MLIFYGNFKHQYTYSLYASKRSVLANAGIKAYFFTAKKYNVILEGV